VRYRIAWRLAWPFRAWVRHSPFQRGKGFLIRHAVTPLLPPKPAGFVTALPGGGRIELQFRETLGFVTLIYGAFERAELESALSLARPGSTAFDVGSNVGLFAVVMARGVGEAGSVVAIEPDPANLRRLRANLALNGIDNVRVVEAAASDRTGSLTLHLSEDSAYHSTGPVLHAQPSMKAIAVEAIRLDDVWRDAGEPVVSMMKIDIEGVEIAALKGSRLMLETHHPALLLEAGGEPERQALHAFLGPLGYQRQPRAGFMPWNHLFVWAPVE
jgi:FkbM family methyltransferase